MMDDLSLRANILKREAFEKNVFIYEDHRYILNILHKAFETETLRNPVTLIYFDKHDDGRDSLAPEDVLANYRNELPSDRDFWNFVEWDLSTQDDDWVKTGMELGFIGDAILIGSKEASNFTDFRNTYTDHTGLEHKIFRVSSIWGGLNHQGWLTDTAQRRRFGEIWDILGWEINPHCRFNSDLERPSFIVDFDLDCFTTEIEGYTIPWQKEIFEDLFNAYKNRCNSNSTQFLQEMIRHAEFITLTRESNFCGGIEKGNQIFSILNDVIFQNQL